MTQDDSSAFSPAQSVLNFRSPAIHGRSAADASPAYAAPPSRVPYTNRPSGHQRRNTKRLAIERTTTTNSTSLLLGQLCLSSIIQSRHREQCRCWRFSTKHSQYADCNRRLLCKTRDLVSRQRNAIGRVRSSVRFLNIFQTN